MSSSPGPTKKKRKYLIRLTGQAALKVDKVREWLKVKHGIGEDQVTFKLEGDAPVFQGTFCVSQGDVLGSPADPDSVREAIIEESAGLSANDFQVERTSPKSITVTLLTKAALQSIEMIEEALKTRDWRDTIYLSNKVSKAG